MMNFDKYIGKVLDRRYKVTKIIGIGGMAVVFEAIDLSNNKVVAIKLLKEEISTDSSAVRRFINESKVVSMLSHPNIVRVYNVSFKNTMKYIVMERVEGITLKSYMEKRGAIPLAELLSYLDQILKALDHAHTKGIIHRDIKPQNIMLLKSGIVKVTDFGIAKLPNAETVTITDKAIGTVHYISPEQAAGKHIDARSDIYSLGVLAYEMATGKLPFEADSPVSIAMMQINNTPKKPREIESTIPMGLEQYILTAMEKNPEKRFQSASQARAYLAKLKSDPKIVFKSLEGPGGVIALKRRHENKHSMLPIICGVFVSFFLVAIVAGNYLLQQLLSSATANNPYTIVVPEVQNTIYSEELTSQFNTAIYKLTVEYEYSSDVPENTIISQDPKAGEKRKVLDGEQYCELKLVVSKGAEEVSIPDVTITDHRIATSKLQDMGLNVTEKEVKSDIDSGLVVSTSPAAGETLKIGETITINVSASNQVTMLTVPQFLGKTEQQAAVLFRGNGTVEDPDFVVGEVTYEPSTAYGKGYIMRQSKAYGSTVARGTVIDIVICTGSK